MPKKKTEVEVPIEEKAEGSADLYPVPHSEGASPNHMTLTNKAETAMAVNDFDGETGLEDMDSSDLIIPRTSIGQEKTEDIDPEEIGRYRNSVSGEAVENISIVPLLYKKGRTLMPEYEPGVKSRPLCKSSDCVTPDSMDYDEYEQKSDNCKDCSYSKWGRKASGKPNPPECAEQHNFVMFDLDPDNFGPMTMVFRVTSAPAAKKILSGLATRTKAMHCPMWHLSFKLGITSKEGVYLPTVVGPFPLRATPELEEMGMDTEYLKQTMTDARREMENARHDFELGAAGAETGEGGGGDGNGGNGGVDDGTPF